MLRRLSLCGCALLLIGFLLAAQPPEAWETDFDKLPKAEQVRQARIKTNAEPYVSEMGGTPDPATSRYPGMTDAQLEQEATRLNTESTTLKAREYQAAQVLESYRQKVVGKGPEPGSDPRLRQLTEAAHTAGRNLCGNIEARLVLGTEMRLRANPKDFVLAERELQGYARDAREVGRFWSDFLEALERKEPWAVLRFEAEKEKDARMHSARMKTVPNAAFRAPAPSGAAKPQQQVEIKYSSLYGPRADPAKIQVIESGMIERLPAPLKGDMPVEVQRVFAYGGYERLPDALKQRVLSGAENLRIGANLSGRTLAQQVDRIFETAQVAKSPMWLRMTASSDSTTKSKAAESLAWLLMAFTQECVTSRYEGERKEKWKAAYRDVAARVPRGQEEKVTFLEEMERQQLDMIVWFECKRVVAYRGSMQVDGCPAEPTEKLPDLRNERKDYWMFTQATRTIIYGTGAAIALKTVRDAYLAGCDLGTAARAGRLDRDTMRLTYAEYNQKVSTREAFKKGYSAGANGKLHCSQSVAEFLRQP
jgi:hypothetical protein